jgi:predicted ATPase/class 3 adenylate cyclase
MFTDIEGSTGHAQRLDSATFADVISRHHELLRGVLEQTGGVEVSTEGDAFFAVFEAPGQAIESAITMQRQIAREKWPSEVDLRVRIGLHTGSGVLGGDNYVGVDVHRASRIAHAGHGGQIVLSGTTAELVDKLLPAEARLTTLGKVRLAGFSEPEQIFQMSVDGLPNEFPPLRGVAPISHLPSQPTAFVGRELELENGEKLLHESRLLTLTGPGGTGKTRLSIELGRRVEPLFEDGVHFISLASITDAGLMPTTVLEGLGLNTAPSVDPSHHLNEYLVDKTPLLILDNLEQLSTAGAAFIAQLLANIPSVKVIATSRSPLRVAGEREMPVSPLPVPEENVDYHTASEFAAVSLFVDRALAVNPRFQLTDENTPAVLQLARRLDGLPLALELAASHMRNLNLDLILDRIDNRLLTSRAPDVPERQQTIINAIGWSYDLLDDEAKEVFELCSVFSGSFGLTEVEDLISAAERDTFVLGQMSNLLENSLVQTADGVSNARYRMLMIIKEYAYAALISRGEADQFERLHAQVYTDLAEQAADEILTSKQRFWLDRLTLDHDNLRTAFDWAVRTEDASTALRLVAALWRFWQTRGHLPEARQKADRAVAMEGGTPRERAKALLALGGILYWQGDWQGTLEPCRDALDLLREHGTQADVADAAYNLAFPTSYSGDHDEAVRLLNESLEISKRLEDRTGVGRAYWGLGDIAGYREDWSRQLEMMLEATEELEEVDAPFDLGWAHFMTAYALHRLNRGDEARGQLVRALDIFESVSDLSAMTLIFESLGLNSIRKGDFVKAARLAGASERLKKETGVAITEVSVNKYTEYEDLLRSSDPSVQAAYEEGLELSLEEVLSLARS